MNTPQTKLERPLGTEAALRMMATLSEFLDRNGLVLFCGGCNDRAVLIHQESGLVLGQDSTPVWMGGDFNGVKVGNDTFCPSVGPKAEQFLKH